jgi:dihydroneopterin aldolase
MSGFERQIKKDTKIRKENAQTCVSSSVKCACFRLLERLADSLLESILKDNVSHQALNLYLNKQLKLSAYHISFFINYYGQLKDMS